MPLPDKLRDTVLPRGEGGLLPPGPVAPGVGELDPATVRAAEAQAQARVDEAAGHMQALARDLTPQMTREVAASAARAEARGAVEEVLAEERRRQEEEAATRKDKLRPFYGFMESLRNLATNGPGGEGPEGRTELVLKLYRLVETGGPKAQRVFQTQASLSQDEALGLGDPDLEGRTMEWALQQGAFGRFEWRLLGWADGESILDTTYVVTVEAPANYVPPARPAVAAAEPELRPDPMGQLRETLGLMGVMREALGLKGGGGADPTAMESVKAAAEMRARLEERDRWDRERRDLEDRHRKALEEAEAKGHARGLEEGRREVRDELQPRLQELTWKLEAGGPGPDVLDRIVGAMGGPEGVSSLVGAVVGALNKPKAAAPKPIPARTKPEIRARMLAERRAQGLAAPAPAAPPQPVPGNVQPLVTLPTPHAFAEALDSLREALAVLEEQVEAHPENAEARQLLEALEAVEQEAEKPEQLGAWWQAWTSQWKAIAEEITQAAEAAEALEESPMDIEGLKSLLRQRLDEGASAEAILAELRELVPVETLEQWRGLLGFVPTSAAVGLMGVEERHRETLKALLEAFKG